MTDRRDPKKKSGSDRPGSGSDPAPVWQPSPALADALRRYSERPPALPQDPDGEAPTLVQKGPSEAPSDPLPQVSGLRPAPLPRLDEPDEQGMTRLRPQPAPPLPGAPRQEETLLYVSSRPPPPAPPPPVAPAAAPPRARWRAGWVAASFFVLAIVVGVLATLAYRALRWLH